jgi:hypothetical protein
MNKVILKAVLEDKLSRAFLHLAKKNRDKYIFMKVEGDEYWTSTGKDYHLQVSDSDLDTLKLIIPEQVHEIFIGFEK